MNAPLFARAASAYRSVQVTTASPTQIVVLLYQGVFRFLREAKSASAADDRGAFGKNIARAHAILELLLNTIDERHAPDLARNLTAVYGFCLRRLVHANLTQDATALDEIETVLTPIHDAWVELGVRLHPDRVNRDTNPGAVLVAKSGQF